MEQQINTSNISPMDNLDFILTSNVSQSSLSTEEIGTRVRYDYNTWESFYEIDVADLNMTLYSDELFKDLLDEFKAIQQYSASSSVTDDLSELLADDTHVLSPIESNDMADRIQSTDEHLAMIKPSNPVLPVIRSHTGKIPTKNLLGTSIELSTSVAVTVPTPNQLQILLPLEDTYRARYKSDYFPQNGLSRRPRYVADKAGHHYITLQMPTAYKRDFTNEYIRVALITTSIDDRGHFYSPYKFQTNHHDAKVPDQNPIYIPVSTQQKNNFTMKLQLVLIKSKLDQLNDAQPLKSFSDTITNIQNIIHDEKLTPKDLINTYQLEKSHIAFTLCTKLSNGLYDSHPETTVISSIITESSAKQLAISNNKSGMVTKTIRKKICCPKCSHYFDYTNDNVTLGVKKRQLNASTTQFNKYLHTYNMSQDQLSVEEFLTNYSIYDNDIQQSLALNENLSDKCHVSSVNNIAISYDSIDFIDPQNCGIDKSDLDLYLSGQDSSKSIEIDVNADLALNNYIPIPFKKLIRENTRMKSRSNSIPLSESVGVTMPKQTQNLSHRIEIVHDLEIGYKPRYKSDYFSQDGTIRKPRYVADRIVLIKAKQEELKSLQSLKPFPDILDVSYTINLKSMLLLNPKHIIQEYQLDRSQLAFTFCTLSPDGKSCIPEWNTTVYSTVLTEENELFPELGLDHLFGQDFFSFNSPFSSEYNYQNFTESIGNPVESDELDRYLGPGNSRDLSFERDDTRALISDLFVSPIENKNESKSNTRPIELSSSVGVGQPQISIKPSHQIQIVFPLEEFFRARYKKEFFRARYKSDYFTHDGKSRKPRYVADRVGNHFITLQIPLGVSGGIRVDWLTIPTESHERYSMPYRFQRDNVSTDVSDCNPVYMPIKTDKAGMMKLYLVLIKSKQDELKSLQPLKPFRPLQDVFGISNKNNFKQMPQLHPKQLIQKYQLDKSQLAFTYCALSSNGKNFIPEWDTTVYSTVLTEVPPENLKRKTLSCPNCAHVFDLSSVGDDHDSIQETVKDKRKVNERSCEKPIQPTKKRKSIPNDIVNLHCLSD
ncbi:unnamed protein product [Rotaria sordida]|uniref:Uncharacterized protein n=1 Tax=Rotaria sordida TaxID=392033 RepID=A0A819PNM6_9BILA|nr:unnamed protein product [Rotaria sordida]